MSVTVIFLRAKLEENCVFDHLANANFSIVTCSLNKKD